MAASNHHRSIEEFKRQLAILDDKIATAATSRLCVACQPVGARLQGILAAEDKTDFHVSARDSTGNIFVGNLDHILSHIWCALCALIARLFIRTKTADLYPLICRTSQTEAPITTDDIRATLPTLRAADQAHDLLDQEDDDECQENDDVSPGFRRDDEAWIEERGIDNIQVSVDAIVTTGAVSVWLPLKDTDEVNDEESQLFLHPEDYRAFFGEPPAHVRLPEPLDCPGRDMEMMRQCFCSCQASHASCKAPARANPAAKPPSRLVDVKEMKIVETATIEASSSSSTQQLQQQQPVVYFALSYVWGTRPFPVLLQSNIATLSHSRSLLDLADRLPSTIRDAITVTRSFGTRYVWIDSLCIVQDSDDDKTDEIRRMHEIYATASLTIVAATGNDAWAPLASFDPPSPLVSQYRPVTVVSGSQDRHEHTHQHQHQHQVQRQHVRLCLDRPELNAEVSFTTWATRGWTLQELACSPRILYFTPRRTYFACQAGNWNEDFPLSQSTSPGVLSKSDFDDDPKGATFIITRSVSSSWSGGTGIGAGTDTGTSASGAAAATTAAASCYLAVVEKLCVRQFTRDDDVLRAMMGVYAMFAAERLGTAVSGLPAGFFEAALMWQPAGRLRRRGGRGAGADSGGAGTGKETTVLFPSWSWAGWVGPVTYPFYELDRAGAKQVVRWHLCRMRRRKQVVEEEEEEEAGEAGEDAYTKFALSFPAVGSPSAGPQDQDQNQDQNREDHEEDAAASGAIGGVVSRTEWPSFGQWNHPHDVPSEQILSLVDISPNWAPPPHTTTDSVLEHTALMCLGSTRSFPVRPVSSYDAPDIPSRAGVRFLSILAPDGTGSVVGELKTDEGTLDHFFASRNSTSPFPARPQLESVELLHIADMDFSTGTAQSAVWMCRYGRGGQFSGAFMKLVEEHTDMMLVMWVDRRDAAADVRRIGTGYVSQAHAGGLQEGGAWETRWVLLR